MSAVLVSSPEEQAVGAAAALSSTPASEATHCAPATWEEVYHSVSPAQQAELLARARAQGGLYAHHLPAVPKPTPAPAAGKPAATSVLSRLLAGHVEDLQALRPGAVAVVDAGLDSHQREAVARALATPDIGLIQGWPGTGKSRVVAEVLTQAAARGERVLFLAPIGAALDNVLERVAGRDAVCAVRCLGRDETQEGLPPAVRPLTLIGRGRQLREGALPAAREARAAAERRCECHGREETIWPQLLDFAETHQRLQGQLTDLCRRRGAVPQEVECEMASAQGSLADAPGGAGSLQIALTECRRSHEDKRHDLETALAKVEQQRHLQREAVAALHSQVEALRPLADAKRKGRWWSPAWWWAAFRGNVPGQMEALEAEHLQAVAALEGLDEQSRQAQGQIQQAEETFRAEEDRLRQEEVQRRQADLADQEAALRHELDLLEEKGRQLCGRLSPEAARPDALTPAVVRKARDHWQARRDRDRQGRDLAGRWADYLAESAGALAHQLAAYANVVAAPLSALAGDAVLAQTETFDLLVLEETDQMTEAELLRAAGRARRWVLVGAPAPELAPPLREPAPPRGRPRALRPAPALQPGCFHRLWSHLHCDPSRLPFVWAREGERLCCRLHPVAVDQRHRLESERVADFPEIELRILNLPRATPILAEVLFPAAMSIEEAKGYIYRELQELPVQAPGRSASWDEQPEAVVFRMGRCIEPDARPVLLEEGVRELVAAGPCGHAAAEAPPWHTCRLEFDRAAGWQRERAEEWVRRHLRLRDLGRTASLDAMHRMTQPLAAVLGDVLGQATSHPVEPASPAGNPAPAVEFVAVPPLERGKGRNDMGARPNGAALPRAGAGLELDLSGPRHPDRLPTPLRGLLPSEGLVNYLEAQAVVRKLAELRADPSLRATGAGPRPMVAVMALYPAQVTLLRELLRQAGAPAADGPAVEVDLPQAFRQRECHAAVISLTRSHSHRAVPLGESPDLLALALTRARARLVVIGDPGTLARRGQWQGALDHLDEHAAAREGRLVGRLLQYVQGQGRHGQAFRLCEGAGT
jgi:hypothetical protein